ncbi:MAG: leucyl/phenylalanyl-tRNA--protein transferase [Pseudomonadota bacterium]
MSDRTSELELTPSLLLRAYAAGVFPMADSADASEVLWIDPQLRGIMPLNQFHAPRSLLKRIRRGDYSVTFDKDFEGVINGCAARDTTWINDEIRRLYIGLFRMGYAHSVEARRGGELVGGLYGVKLGGAFFGESMFTTATDASKVALVYLVARLKVGGFSLLDTQFVTDHLAHYGARTVSRTRYHELLELAVTASADFDRLDPDTPPQDVAQLSTQRSYR